MNRIRPLLSWCRLETAIVFLGTVAFLVAPAWLHGRPRRDPPKELAIRCIRLRQDAASLAALRQSTNTDMALSLTLEAEDGREYRLSLVALSRMSDGSSVLVATPIQEPGR